MEEEVSTGVEKGSSSSVKLTCSGRRELRGRREDYTVNMLLPTTLALIIRRRRGTVYKGKRHTPLSQKIVFF